MSFLKKLLTFTTACPKCEGYGVAMVFEGLSIMPTSTLCDCIDGIRLRETRKKKAIETVKEAIEQGYLTYDDLLTMFDDPK